MRLLDALANVALEGLWAIESRSRERGQLDLKMELFVAAYGDRVLNQGIPIDSNRTGYQNKRPFVTCYVRTEHSSGSTRFNWFNDIENAESFATNERLNANVRRVIGPFLLPKDKESRFK